MFRGAGSNPTTSVSNKKIATSMTEGEKCGLSSILPMSCRTRAEAFARSLHTKLHSLGSQDDNGSADESSWLAANENPIALSQPRHASDTDMYFDFGLLESPGSPENEVEETELQKLINKDTLKHSHSDECRCPKAKAKRINIANSLASTSNDSDSDGPFYDTENFSDERLHLNGDISSEFSKSLGIDVNSDDISGNPEDSYASTSECTPQKCSADSLSEDISTLSLKDDVNGSLTDVSKCISDSSSDSNDFAKYNGDVTPLSTEAEIEVSHLDINKDLTIEYPNIQESILNIMVNQNSTDELTDVGSEPVSETTVKDEVIEIRLEPAPEIPVNYTNGAQLHNDKLNERLEPLISQTDGAIDDDEGEEERTPRVRRCSSLKTGKTPPGTPIRKKIVRFADAMGLDLADVRTFLDEIPRVPISAYEDLSVDLSESPSESSNSLNHLNNDIKFHGVKVDKILMPLFQQPGGLPNFLDLVRENQVCLENAVVDDPLLFSVKGTVRVRNLDFHKSLHVRYSLNSWKTFADVQATYVDNSCDGFSDKFSFIIYAHTLTVGEKLEFACRFQCKGCQYWDSNRGANYIFQCLPATNHTPAIPITHGDEWGGASFYYARSKMFKSKPVQSPLFFNNEHFTATGAAFAFDISFHKELQMIVMPRTMAKERQNMCVTPSKEGLCIPANRRKLLI